MTELEQLVWNEKWRPQKFEDLISNKKDVILKYIASPKEMPSFIFSSQSPGTGKTTTAQLIAKELDCDMTKLNASDERGIDVIREKIKMFIQSLSSNNKIKRMVFLDEADFLTSTAQASLRSMMEEYSDNAFFVFSVNDISKIIDPIKSRCITINFENIDKTEIFKRLKYICEEEKIQDKLHNDLDNLNGIIEQYYPDIRSMIKTLQNLKYEDYKDESEVYNKFLEAIKKKQIEYIYEQVYTKEINILGWNKWMFKHLFENYKEYEWNKCSKISLLLADNEKAWNMGSNLPIVFLANVMKIGEII